MRARTCFPHVHRSSRFVAIILYAAIVIIFDTFWILRCFFPACTRTTYIYIYIYTLSYCGWFLFLFLYEIKNWPARKNRLSSEIHREKIAVLLTHFYTSQLIKLYENALNQMPWQCAHTCTHTNARVTFATVHSVWQLIYCRFVLIFHSLRLCVVFFIAFIVAVAIVVVSFFFLSVYFSLAEWSL